MRTSTSGRLLLAASLAALNYAAALRPLLAQQQPTPGQPGFGELLIKAARASPGCLGIETGQTTSGTRIILAWFEDKKAIVAWYKSDFHQRAMKSVFPQQNFNREPLPDMPEGSGPILALVTLRPGEGPPTSSLPIPMRTIGIELYTPLPGGVAVGGRFSPETVKIPGLRRIDLKRAAEPAR
jgi:hypothetical protein